MFASALARVPRLGRLPRLCLIGVCLLLALYSTATDAAGPARSAGPVGPVVVAARALPAGHVVGPGDVRIVEWPRRLRPASARARPADVLGRRLSGAIGAGEPLTANRVVGRDALRGLPSGLAAVGVPLANGRAVDFVRPGDRVDLLATRRTDGAIERVGAGTVRTLGRSALTLAIFRDGTDGGAEIVLAVPRTVGATVARDAATDVFTVVVVPP